MKNYKKYIILLTLVSLPVFASGEDEPLEGRVWLYFIDRSDGNEKKGPFEYYGEVEALIEELRKEEIALSSVKVGNDTKVTLYENTGYKGKHIEITKDKDGLNFKVGSLKVEKTQ